MLDKDKKFSVAMIKCYFCGEPSGVVMNRYLTKSSADVVDDMHNKVIDMTPCSKCEEFMKQGVILITVDDNKSSKGWQKDPMPNPYRTGGFFVVKESALEHILPKDLYEYACRARWLFIDHQVAESIGLFDSIEDG